MPRMAICQSSTSKSRPPPLTSFPLDVKFHISLAVHGPESRGLIFPNPSDGIREYLPIRWLVLAKTDLLSIPRVRGRNLRNLLRGMDLALARQDLEKLG